MCVDALFLISEFLHGTQLRSLLLHQNARLVFTKIALETLRTAFVFTQQTCTAMLAVTPLTQKIQNLCVFRWPTRQNAQKKSATEGIS